MSAVPEDNAVATTPMPRKTRIEGGLYYVITHLTARQVLGQAGSAADRTCRFMNKTPLSLLLLFLAITGIASAQSGARTKSTKGEKDESYPSLKNLPPGERFTSRDGGFSIALPKEPSGTLRLTPDSGVPGYGEVFQFVTEEAGFSITYVDYTRPDFNLATDQQYINYFGGIRNGVIQSRNAKILTEREITFAGQRCYAFTFMLPEGFKGAGRAFVLGKRGYTLLANFEDDPDHEKLATNALESFELLPIK